MVHRLEHLVVRHALRLPAPEGPAGDGGVAARQFDATLMSVGFKLSAPLLERLSGLAEAAVLDIAVRTLAVVRELVGDHVRHNTYFIDFPANVPDTLDFWMRCIREALADDATRADTLEQLSSGVMNLLTLPSYGRYRHTYTEMLGHHDELIAAAGDRMTVLHLGGDARDEIGELYLKLAGSRTPLSEDHLRDLDALAAHCVDGRRPEEIPVRENRAVINRARLRADPGAELLLDTVTDVLRLACALADGDVSLLEPTRFGKLSRPTRRALLAGLDAVVAAVPAKLADVPAHREAWKRLGERLHPHEYPRWPHAAQVFAVARGEQRVRSFASRTEELLGRGDVPGAVHLLGSAPGALMRSVDRLARSAGTDEEYETVLTGVEKALPRVSGRVLLSVRRHLLNRGDRLEQQGARRVFVNRRGRAWVTDDTRPALPEAVKERLTALLDAEIARRAPVSGPVLVDPDFLDVALPLSDKAVSSGLGVLPRGSVSPVEGELLRFFVYWKQKRERTDFDLSAVILDEHYEQVSWLSYTQLTAVEGRHSGDVVEAPHGASEFIELRLGAVRGSFVVPQVLVFSGEGFMDVEESFFGFMLREHEQKGRPFEPRTVRMKSDLRGPGRVALPLVFQRADDGSWRAHWLHLCLRGMPSANRVEETRVTVEALARGIVEREQLTVRRLLGLLPDAEVTLWDGESVPEGPVTFMGMRRPEGLHPGSRVLTPENLRDVIPE
ncbi:hypothetical protein [Streptomyces sp. VRA16 Mangrove soil]|uniref:hypothetical protein n=1 Tax=Streptomyces sp. VRA16 Mangrove soil TaxID=2817434 RepID=UPI001A9E761A|nr:hypothetical protein [Streptomyces sp. VRA16 Mangrove soil]MBO1329927.1 hypothetical protein [Streptomyces sp. VRA16 Mangrove soil]